MLALLYVYKSWKDNSWILLTAIRRHAGDVVVTLVLRIPL